MKLDPPPGKVPDLRQLDSLATRRSSGRSLLGACLLVAVMGGPASLAGGVGQETGPATQRAWVTAFAAGDTPQKITFKQPPDAAVGVRVALLASAAPGLMVSFTSNTPQVCAVSQSTVTTMTAGVCTITASQGGDAHYAPAPEVARSFQVTTGQKTQTTTLTLPPDVVQRGVSAGVRVALLATAPDSGLPVSLTSNTPAVCTVSGSTALAVAVGVCTIIASQGGSATYAPTAATQSFLVTAGQTPQKVTLALPPDVLKRGVPAGVRVALLASAPDSGLPVSLTSNTPAVCTASGSTALAVAAGVCTITASQGGSAIFAPTDAARSFRVRTGQQTQTVMFTLPPELVQRGVPVGEPVTLSASAPDSGLAVSFTSATPQVCIVSGSTVLTLAADAGPCTITASQNGNATYAPTDAEQSFPVTTGQETQTITFTLPSELVQNGVPVGQPVALSASAPDSGLAVSFTSATPQVCTVSGSTVLTLAASHGPCTITASQNGNATYAPTDAEQSFPVTTGDKGQRITFTLPPEVKQGVPVGEPVTLSASASSRLPVSFTSTTPRVCTVSGSTVLTLATGRCTIIALQNGSVIYAAVSGQGPPFKVIRAGQTIIFDQPLDAKVGDRVTLVASATSGLPVSFTSTTHVCMVSQFIATAVTNGTCTIIASQSGDANYLPAPEARQSFHVKNGQTITFDQPPDAKVGDRVPLTASATSELQVSFTSTTPDICTVSEATATAGGAGTCTITASQAGDATYAAADNVQHSFQVKNPQTITFDQPPDAKVGDRVTLPASATSGLPVSLTSTTPGVCTVSEATATVVAIATAVAPGTCTITASQSGNDTYAAAPNVQHSFQVTRARQTVTFVQPPDAKVGERFTLSASASSRLPVSFTSTTPDICTVSGSTVAAAAAGTCTITASQAGGAAYAPADNVQHSFQVKNPQTITFDQLKDADVKARVTLSASASSRLPVSFTSTTPTVCTVSGSTVLTLVVGTCTITASQAGNSDYAAADDVRHSFRVTRATRQSQKISFPQPADTTAGQQVTLSASASSGLPVSFTSTTPDICTVAGATVTTVIAGTCTITASQSGNDRYGQAPKVQHSFQVNAGDAPQTIAFAQPPDTTAGQQVTLSASASSGLPVSFSSTTPDICAVSGSTVTTMAVGTCTITASQAGNATYAAASGAQHSFQVAPGKTPQTIAFAQPPDTTAGQHITLSASASSGLPVSFTSGTPPVCAASGSTVTTATAGTCMITASQGGSDSYAAAPNATESFQVNPADQVKTAGRKPQTITFRQPAEAKTGVPVGEPVTLSASASSGLPVSFTSTTPPVCRVSGSTVTTLATGACTITASQDGSAGYAAARAVAQSFQVNPASSKRLGALVFLLAAATMAAAGVTLAVRRLRLRSHPPPAHAPDVRAVPDTGPPGQVNVRNTGTTATHTVRIEPSPGASTTTIEEVQP